MLYQVGSCGRPLVFDRICISQFCGAHEILNACLLMRRTLKRLEMLTVIVMAYRKLVFPQGRMR